MGQASMRNAVANKKYMGYGYEEMKRSSYISYVSASNLYGLAVGRKLPYKKVRYVKYGFKEEIPRSV